jgi:hypothetical protein
MADHSGPGDGVTESSPARVLDYLLGDGRNFAVDRRLADMLQRVMPDVALVAQLARTFMRRAVTHLVTAGVRQFLDLSVGTTAVGNVHEIAQAADPACRVVYAHTDPISVAHTRQLLTGRPGTAVIQADPRDTRGILAACREGGRLDVGAPIGLLMVSGLALLPDTANLVKMVADYRERVVPGSHLVISHLSGDQWPKRKAAIEVASVSFGPIRPRTREEVVSLFAGFELLAPGVVDAGRWHAERPLDPTEECAAKRLHVGVGRKPGPEMA